MEPDHDSAALPRRGRITLGACFERSRLAVLGALRRDVCVCRETGDDARPEQAAALCHAAPPEQRASARGGRRRVATLPRLRLQEALSVSVGAQKFAPPMEKLPWINQWFHILYYFLFQILDH